MITENEWSVMTPQARCIAIRDMTQEQAVALYSALPFNPEKGYRLTKEEWEMLGSRGQKLLKPKLSAQELLMIEKSPVPKIKTTPKPVLKLEPQNKEEEDKPANGCLGLFLIVLCVLGVIAVVSDNNENTSSQSEQSGYRLMTKNEWRSKLSARYEMARFGSIGCTAQGFLALMGRPDRTQTLGDTAYWYYDCYDGTIQLALQACPLQMGLIAGEINDY